MELAETSGRRGNGSRPPGALNRPRGEQSSPFLGPYHFGKMRLVFVGGSLEPGRDGVGDYSRLLAAELVRQGCRCALLGLRDPFVERTALGAQESAGVLLPALRLPASLGERDRRRLAGTWLCEEKPDWLSLQFVPFAFHPKGLVFGLGGTLKSIAPGCRWHFMFHELWLGLGRRPKWKHRLWGLLQRRLILEMIRACEPSRIDTQSLFYLAALRAAGIARARRLPLFGNVPFARLTEGGRSVLAAALEKLSDGFGEGSQARARFYVALVFGSVHREWNFRENVTALARLARKDGYRLVVAFVGRNGIAPDDWRRFRSEAEGLAELLRLGELTPEELSHVFQQGDLGLATTPLSLIDKSGTAAAMLEHGLSLVVSRWNLDDIDGRPGAAASAALLSLAALAGLQRLPRRNPVVDVSRVGFAAKTLHRSLAL